MPSAVDSHTFAPAISNDDLDNLLNYDAAVDDFRKDLEINNETNAGTATAPEKDIDEEITLKRKRKPVPKLDENLLLSRDGIPKLRRISKTRLRLRGKGHEFGDISMVLNMYQLWMDDMYPRAKFRDAMVMIEKVGHSKRMQVMRRTWLDETKPGRTVFDEDGVTSALDPTHTDVAIDDTGSYRRSLAPEAGTVDRHQSGNDAPSRENNHDDIPEDDELDALLGEGNASSRFATSASNARVRGPFEEEDSEEDDLDALLSGDLKAWGADRDSTSTSKPQVSTESDETRDDDLDALLVEQVTDSGARTGSTKEGSQSRVEHDFADEEAVLAEMDGVW